MPAYSSGAGLNANWASDATRRMNRMYRWQRYIYDATRRYYLLGRDHLVAGLRAQAGESVLEIGCGTGRNLVLAARRYPDARFFGLDVSTEMLATAASAVSRAGFAGRIRLAHGDGTAFDPHALFGVGSFDHIMISYSLSMILEWRGMLQAAANHLSVGGRLHVVDFGSQDRLPNIARKLLRRWLAIFDVTPRDDLKQALLEMAAAAQARLQFETPFGSYAQYGVLTLANGFERR